MQVVEAASPKNAFLVNSAAMRVAQGAPSHAPQLPGCPVDGAQQWAGSTLCASLCCGKHSRGCSDLLLSNTLRTDGTRLPQRRTLCLIGSSAAVRSAVHTRSAGVSLARRVCCQNIRHALHCLTRLAAVFPCVQPRE